MTSCSIFDESQRGGWHMLYHIAVLKLVVNTHTAKPSATGYARIKKNTRDMPKMSKWLSYIVMLSLDIYTNYVR